MSGQQKHAKMIVTYWSKDDPRAIPAPTVPPNDMRPRVVDRAKVKAARKVSRRNRRRR